jgi:hypothetical protein
MRKRCENCWLEVLEGDAVKDNSVSIFAYEDSVQLASNNPILPTVSMLSTPSLTSWITSSGLSAVIDGRQARRERLLHTRMHRSLS